MLQTMAAKQCRSAEVPAPAATTELVAADQLNDVDRALSETKTTTRTRLPRADGRDGDGTSPAAVMASQQQDSTWGQTSLIGKIFIAFGGLLTLASAARMFMA